MKKIKPLREYKSLFIGDDDIDKNRAVPEHIFNEIERFVLENTDTVQFLKPGYKKGLGKVLQAQNYVGVIQTKNGTTIEILPKISNLKDKKDENGKVIKKEQQAREILINMLRTLKNSPFKSLHKAHLKTKKMPLFEIFISMFLEELAILIRKGIKSDYIAKEDNLHFLKGKLKINEQIKYNYIHKERFFVAYDEYSSDRIENRLIKTTLQYLYKKSKSSRSHQRIREFLFVFDEVKPSKNFRTDFTKVKSNRQMRDYEQVLLWCKTFLLGDSFSPYKGNSVAFALLFDMNKLFESYVYDYLRKEGEYGSITAQDSGYHLAYLNGKDAKFRLKPDIVINKNVEDRKTIVVDTKWKLLREDSAHKGVSQSDMYQLFAYGTKYEKCDELYLVYPKSENVQIQDYSYYQDGEPKLNLHIRFFDVTLKHSDQKFRLGDTNAS